MKMKKATRNKKERDIELSEAKPKEMVISTSHVNEKTSGGMSDKKNKLKKKKRNRENSVHEDVAHDNEDGDHSNKRNDLDGVNSLKKMKKVAKNKKRKGTETPENEITEAAFCTSPDDVNMSDKKKSKLKKKKSNKQKRKKDEHLLHSDEVGPNSNQQIVKSQSSVDDEDGVYEISSGDEDETTGMKRWIGEYHESRPGAEVLLQQINDLLVNYWAEKEKERRERESEAAEGGWTVVTHMKGRKKTTDAESGTTVGSVAQAAVLDNLSKKKHKQSALNFYRFQKRDAQRNEIMMLQSKLEQDKKRIQLSRAARKFRPY